MKDNLNNGLIDQKEPLYLRNEFHKKEKVWILIVDHDMLDEIEYEIENCTNLYNDENKGEFLSAASRLCDAIEDLSKREEISLANIF